MPEELQELLSRLVGKIREDDLLDPEMSALLAQLICILDPEPEAMPLDLIDELSGIPDKIQRFKAAAAKIGSNDPGHLRDLAMRMQAAGLLKTEDIDVVTGS